MADIENLPYHRKYRPTSMIKYIGNTKVKETAFKALAQGNRPQVVMLTGSSGCGKTSFARLLAKEYSCENRDEVTGACGCCTYCQAIDDYISTGSTDMISNIKEVNVADQSGKRDLDYLLSDMEIPAFGSEWKIYILDECHEATSALQNKLLKITEEPPEQVLIIFCTTNPEKMIETLKNRCQLQLKVAKPKVKELAGLLRYVCENEQVEYDNKGLEFIANRGELTIRTALQNLQQVVTEKNDAKYESATQVFEEVSMSILVQFFKALKTNNVFDYVTTLYKIKSKMDLSVFLTQITGFVKAGIYTINGIHQEGVSDNELAVYRDMFGDLGVAQIGFLLNRLLTLNVNNLEMELLMLGYSGITNIDGNVGSVFDSDIPVIENELSRESKTADKVIKEREEVEFNRGVENAKKQMAMTSIEAVMAMGGVLVEDES